MKKVKFEDLMTLKVTSVGFELYNLDQYYVTIHIPIPDNIYRLASS